MPLEEELVEELAELKVLEDDEEFMLELEEEDDGTLEMEETDELTLELLLEELVGSEHCPLLVA